MSCLKPGVAPWAWSLALIGALHLGPVHAQGAAPHSAPAAAPAASAPPPSSDLDGPLFFQLMLAEFELASGRPGPAYEYVMEAARRLKRDELFRRAVDIAIQARAGEQALVAARAWRLARPAALDAARTEVQVLGALNRLGEAVDPLRAVVRLSPAEDRAGLISSLPRVVGRASDRRQAATLLDEVLKPFFTDPALATAARLASARGWLAAGEAEQALKAAEAIQKADAAAPGPTLIALELWSGRPATDPLAVRAQALISAFLDSGKAETPVRLAWARALVGAQRYADAVPQFEQVVRERPNDADPYLTLGALHLDLKQLDPARAALQRYVALTEAARVPVAPPSPASAPANGANSSTPAASDAGTDAEAPEERGADGLVEAWLMLARIAEQQQQFADAERWLSKVQDPARALDVQTRRATLLARQGRVAEAREAIRRAPERDAQDARAKFAAEAGVLRDIKRYADAYTVLEAATRQFPEDSDLLYERAMLAERLQRMDDAERLLRRVMALKPDSPHAYNALGYSLADRGLRLEEARGLIVRALELAPGDPFITDSLGWVEFRLGRNEEALRHLQAAWAARPDTEIGAHLGEVLWVLGRRDEALNIWRAARERDAANEVLKETLARLKVSP
jgi:tetratricopeptide (TPR) repeat protein